VTEQGQSYDVVIIGGGLAGASLAVALSGFGRRIAVIEPNRPGDNQPSYDDRTVALSWGSRLIYESLGLWDAFSEQVEPIRSIHISDRGHFGVTRLHHREEGVDALGYVAENRMLGDVLYTQLAACDDVTLFCPARLVGLQQDVKTVTATINTGERTVELNARLLVAADGVASQVRELLQIGIAIQDYGQSALIANVTPSREHQGVAYERFTDTGPIAMLPMSKRRCSMVWTLPTRTAAARQDSDDTAFLADLQRNFGFRLGRFRQIGRRSLYPLRLIESTQLVRGRVVIVGNAAHTIHPVAGQGFNLALRDIALLRDHVIEGDDAGHARHLEEYVQAREKDAQRVYRFTDALVKIFSNSHPLLGHLRAAGLVSVGLVPPLRHALARQSMGLTLPPGVKASRTGRQASQRW
jgi:2-octaprenyl-6-methoxyphenol hydroxylase